MRSVTNDYDVALEPLSIEKIGLQRFVDHSVVVRNLVNVFGNSGGRIGKLCAHRFGEVVVCPGSGVVTYMYINSLDNGTRPQPIGPS